MPVIEIPIASLQNFIIYPINPLFASETIQQCRELNIWPNSGKAFSNLNLSWASIPVQGAATYHRSQNTLKKYRMTDCPNGSQQSLADFIRILRSWRTTSEHGSLQHLGEPECTICCFSKAKCPDACLVKAPAAYSPWNYERSAIHFFISFGIQATSLFI